MIVMLLVVLLVEMEQTTLTCKFDLFDLWKSSLYENSLNKEKYFFVLFEFLCKLILAIDKFVVALIWDNLQHA